MNGDSPLERLKRAGFTSSPLSWERVQRLQEELDQNIDKLDALMGREWVVLISYVIGEAAASRGLAADLLSEVAQAANVPNVQAPGARVNVDPLRLQELGSKVADRARQLSRRTSSPPAPVAAPSSTARRMTVAALPLPGVRLAKKRAAKKKRGKRS